MKLEAVENGASELDVMVNLTYIKTGQAKQLHREIAEISENINQDSLKNTIHISNALFFNKIV